MAGQDVHWKVDVAAGELIQRERCPLCNATEHRLFFALKSPHVNAEAKLYRCQSCRFVFANPVLGKAALERFYAAKHRYSNYALYSNEFAKLKIRNFTEKLRWIERVLPIKNRTLLDLGCGDGLAMEAAARLGFEPTGVEIAESAVKRAFERGAGKAIRAPIDDLSALGPSTFGLVTLFDVLDHHEDPLAVLKQARERLAPGGVLYLDVGNVESIGARLFGKLWPDFVAHEHVSYFSPQTLRRALQAAGFHVAAVESTRLWATLPYILSSIAESAPILDTPLKIVQTRMPRRLREATIRIPVGFISAIATVEPLC